MMALATTLLILAYLSLCGRAWLAVWRVRLGHSRTWLVSPALGLCLNVMVLTILNQAGLPLAGVARPLAAGLALLAAGIITWRKAWGMKGLGAFMLVALTLLTVSAWPMLQYGFNWTAYGNDDMANYCLTAERLLRHAFYEIPPLSDLAGADYSQYYWFMHAAHLVRMGSDIWLAGVAGVLGRPPIEAFMPVIFALAIAQLWALAALLYSCPRHRKHALVASFLVICCPLWNYGTLAQLIAQVSGIAVLLATVTLTARRRFARGWLARARQAAIISLLAAGMSLIYPEIVPFLVLTLFLVTAGNWLRTRLIIPGQIPVAILSGVLLLVLLRHNVFSTYIVCLGQASSGMTMEDVSKTIFPYLLMPKGVSYLFGFESIVTPWAEPWGSIGIGAGLIGLFFCGWRALRGLWRVIPASCLLAVMLLVGGRLFAGNNGFGLFKLAMFILPVLIAEIAGVLVRPGWRQFKIPFAIILCVGWLTVTERYVHYSRPGRGNVYLEIEEASRSRGQRPVPGVSLLADVMSQPLAKFASMAPGGTVEFRSQPFYKAIMELQMMAAPDWSWRFNPVPDTPAITHRLENELRSRVFLEKNAFGTTFWTTPPESGAPPTHLLTSVQELRSFNAMEHLQPADGLYTQIPLAQLKNHLVFIHSESGQHYYLGHPGSIAVYKAQADVYSSAGSFFAIGQSLVFEVLHPSPRVRLRMSLTNSIMGFGRTRLPEKAAAFGRETAPASFGIVGAGSANVFSQVIDPLLLDGRQYVALNLFRAPDHFPPARLAGLNLLYNRSVQLDPRLMNGYCRDISLISEEEYQAMPRPREVSNFPEGLVAQPNLEYSGLYEDGWVSRDSFVILGAAGKGDQLVIKGMTPALPDGSMDGHNVLEVRVNGVPVPATPIFGDFVVKQPLASSARVRVDLHFTREGPLPGNDERPIAALLTSIAIQSEN